MDASGILTINLSAIKANYRTLQDKVGQGCKVAAVVKANAYGLGVDRVVPALIEAGATTFFAATVDEGIAIRTLDTAIDIYLFNGFVDDRADDYIAHRLYPVLDDFNEVRSYSALALREAQDLPAALHFNTRMNRLGFGSVEAKLLFEDLSLLGDIDVRIVMSHLACADEAGHDMNARQLSEFQEIALYFSDSAKSLANSSGVFLGADYHFDIVRPGMALYGLNPTPGEDNPMRPVISLKVPILRRRRVFEGAVVGYGASYQFMQDTELATIAAGYADGLFRHLSNSGVLYWNDVACPIRGRVSMDLTTVDLSAVPLDALPKPGDYMEVLGAHQAADDLAAAAGTIGYEVLTRLGNRYKRFYSAND